MFAGDDGRLGFHCFHGHCAHRRWNDFRTWHDPSYSRNSETVGNDEFTPRRAGTRVSRETLEHLLADRRTYRLIVEGATSGERWAAVWRTCCRLVRLGFDDDTIGAIITDPAFGISSYMLMQPDGDRAAYRMIHRARAGAWYR